MGSTDLIHQPLNRPISERFDGFGEDDRPRVFVVVQMGNGFLDDVRQCCLFHRMLEDPLDSDIAWLEDPCTSTRDILDKNPGVVLVHPIAELLRAMNRPTVDCPETHLAFSVEEGPLFVKVDTQYIANVTLHSVDI